MVTYNQLFNKIRIKKKREIWLKALEGCPQKKAICMKIYIMKPRKPNSALRKVTKVRFLSSGKTAIVGIPGIGSEVQQHAVVLIRGGRMPDTPGIRYKLLKGKADFSFVESIIRGSRRSKFGVKKKVRGEEKKEIVVKKQNKEDFIIEREKYNKKFLDELKLIEEERIILEEGKNKYIGQEVLNYQESVVKIFKRRLLIMFDKFEVRTRKEDFIEKFLKLNSFRYSNERCLLSIKRVLIKKN